MAQAFLERGSLGRASAGSSRSTRSAFLLFLPYLLLAATAYSVFAATEDDPFITFRYAANLLAGHGPVFNIGERVEADTSPLHMLLCAVLLTLAPGVGILFKAKLFSLLMAGLVIAGMRPLGRQARLPEGVVLPAQCLVALNINFGLAAVNALETTLYAALVVATLTLFLRECRSGRGWGSAVALFVALMARPEALLLFPALLAVRLLWGRRRGRPLASALPWAAAFLVLAALLAGARWGYYGQLLPNTYYAKNVTLMAGVRGGIRYLLHPLSTGAGGVYRPFTPYDRWAVLFAPIFWGLALAGGLPMRRNMAGLTLLAAVAAAVAFVLRAGGDWMQGWRFMVSSLPLLAFMQVRGAIWVSRWLAGRPAGHRRWAVATAVLFWGLTWGVAPHDSWGHAGFTTSSARLLAGGGNLLGPLWVRMATVFRQRFAPGSTIAYSEIGYACYNNLDKRFLDIQGLTDVEIAHLPQAYKTHWGFTDHQWYRVGDPLGDVLKRRRPDAIVIIYEYAGPDVVLGNYRMVHDAGTSGPGLNGLRALMFVPTAAH